MSIISIGGAGIPLPYPANNYGYAPFGGTNKITLAAGQTQLIPAGTWQVVAQVNTGLSAGQECTFALFDGSGTLVANTETKAGYVGGGATFQGTSVGPYNAVDVSSSASYNSQVWRGDLNGQNWTYLGVGRVNTSNICPSPTPTVTPTVTPSLTPSETPSITPSETPSTSKIGRAHV